MKKILVLFMAFVMLLSFIACDDECTEHTDSDKNGKCDNCEAAVDVPCETHKDNGFDGKCDNCGAAMPCDGHEDINLDGKCDKCGGAVEIKVDDTSSLIMAEALISKLEKSNSFKVDFVLDIIFGADVNEYDEDTNEIVTVSEYGQGIAKFTMTASKSENGVNAIIVADVKSKDSKDDEFEVDLKGEVLYIVDGCVYTYDEEEDVFLADALPNVDAEELVNLIEEMTNGLEMTDDEKNQMLTEIGRYTLTTFDVKNNKGSIQLDIKPIYDDFANYIKSLEVSDTVRSIINDALALVDENLTVESILADVDAVYDLTLEEFLQKLDEELQAEYDTTLQGIYDSVMNDGDFEQLFINVMIMGGMSEDEAKESLDAFKLLKIEDIIPEEMMNVTMFDLIFSMISSACEVEYMDKTVLMETVNEMLDITLGQAVTQYGFPFSSILEVINAVEIKEFNTGLDINFEGLFDLSSLLWKTTLDITVDVPSEVVNMTDVYKIKTTLSVLMYEISENTVEIKLPDNMKWRYDVLDRYFYDEEENSFYMEEYDGEITAIMDCGDVTVIVTTDINSLKNTTMTFDGMDIIMLSLDGELLEHNAAQDLIIELDLSNDSFTVISMPEFEMPSEEETVTITYDPGLYGYLVSSNKLVISIGDRVMSHPTPQTMNDGYIFDGWYFDESFTEKVETTHRYDEDTVLFAKWNSADVCTTGGEHQYGQWSVEEEAGCANDELIARACINCGHVETRTGEAGLGHLWSAWSDDGFFVTRTCLRSGCKGIESKEVENHTLSLIDECNIKIPENFYGDLDSIIDGSWDNSSPMVPAPTSDFTITVTLNEATQLDRFYVKGVGSGKSFYVYVKYEGDYEYTLLSVMSFLTVEENNSPDRKIPYVTLDSEKKVEAVQIKLLDLMEATEYFEEIAFMKIEK